MTGDTVLITGGTGSLGQHLTRHLLDAQLAAKVIIYSRDELKQLEMRQAGLTDPRLRYFLGDVRDQQRLRRAMRSVNIVIHAAALKQVDSCEYNPLEAVKTNITGTANVIDAALDCAVGRVLMVGTDKAVDPVNLYGATKLAAEKLMIDANAYSGADGTRFACTRYGNVISSRGSVWPLFQSLQSRGEPLTVTDPGMTRFVLTLDQCVRFVLSRVAAMSGGEVFVPRLPAVTVQTIADAAAWPSQAVVRVTGLRPGEKQHELLISANEASRTIDRGDHFEVRPIQETINSHAGHAFSSDTAERLSIQEFRTLAGLTTRKEHAA